MRLEYHILYLFQNVRGIMIAPRPKTNPISTLIRFQLIWLPVLEFEGATFVTGGNSHDTFKGSPHNPALFSNEASGNYWIWVPNGIFPINSLLERLRNDKKFKFASCRGICPVRWLLERSKASSLGKFPKNDRLVPVRALFDKLSKYNALKSPIASSIGPSNLLEEKSMEVKIVRIFTSSNSRPFMVTVIKSKKECSLSFRNWKWRISE